MRNLVLAAFLMVPAMATAQTPCGGSFSTFVADLKAEAVFNGIEPATADAFFRTVRQDPAVLRADQAQGVFQRPFIDFSRRLISADRINRGRANAKKYNSVFDRIEQDYGVDRGVLLAFWAFETQACPDTPIQAITT